MKRYLKLYLAFLRQSLLSAAMYQADFLVWSAVTIGWFVFNIVFYQLLFGNVDTISGWLKADMFMFQGVYFLFDFFLWGVLWQNMKAIPEKINSGLLDLDLTKPVNTRFFISFRVFRWNNANSLLLGLGTIGYSLSLGVNRPTLLGIALSLLTIIIACIFIYQAWFTTMCLAFFVDRINNLQEFFPGVRNFWRVPQPFYTGLIRVGLTYIVPITLVTTLPVQFLLGQRPLGMLIIFTLLTIGTTLISRLVFSLALRRYSGASS
jgi:ABC-2 type transport system permease protein